MSDFLGINIVFLQQLKCIGNKLDSLRNMHIDEQNRKLNKTPNLDSVLRHFKFDDLAITVFS